MVVYGHVSVLLKETLELLLTDGEPALMIDATLGLAGHSIAFLEKYPELNLIGVDADQAMLAQAEKRLFPYKDRCTLVHGFFDEFFINFAKGGQKADIVLFDLGVSMVHFKEARRGFGLMEDEELDMRLNTQTGRTALDLIATANERELAGLLRQYGEEPFAFQIARAIVRARNEKTLRTARDLSELVKNTVPPRVRYGKVHPATRTFQALRIAVNGELERVERALEPAICSLKDRGVIGVISFHSLEDRIVKQSFMRHVVQKKVNKYAPQKASKTEEKAPISYSSGDKVFSGVRLELLTKKPVVAGAEELAGNPASRSAKLRVARRVASGE